MTEPVLRLIEVSKRFGALVVSDCVSLEVVPGEIHALIGPNGAGKTTLIKQITGALLCDSGQIHFAGQNVSAQSTTKRARLGMGRTFQISALALECSVLQNALLSLLGQTKLSWWHRISVEHKTTAMKALARTGLEHRSGERAEELSHGERRRLELAMALVARPKILLLDEPLAGLGADGSAELTKLLAALKMDVPILLVEHDMDAVFQLADRISVLVGGSIIACASPADIRADPAVRDAYLGNTA